MKRHYLLLLAVLLLLTAFEASADLHYVNLNSPTPAAPYSTWETAAQDIQSAIDEAADGDTVLVTNGVYATGGRVMAGDLTNRVALTKALTVASVNGYAATVIQGCGLLAMNGLGATRCAWLTNEAVLSGFTLQGGGTRTSGDVVVLQSGGGVWCSGTDGVVTNCRIAGNAASQYGGGSYQAALNNCIVQSNSAYLGGGIMSGILSSCLLEGNLAQSAAGGSYGSTLLNCTVLSNFNGGVRFGSCTNCILYFNGGNYVAASLSWCCSTPLATGPGNTAADPQLLPGTYHLGNTSPCRGAGTSGVATGLDLEGQPWANPPSMGCIEWQPAPVFVAQLTPQWSTASSGLTFSSSLAGDTNLVWYWSKDGVPIESGGRVSSAHAAGLSVNGLTLADAGYYQAVVSNAFGMATSAVSVVIHCVDAASQAPNPPYLDWSTAATNIQDAIDAAAPNEFVLVTNGVYASGGKAMAEGLTNRVTLDKPLAVTSVNGYAATVIQGMGLLPTNGPAAVRCAWLTNGAVLNGFTLRGGATHTTGDVTAGQSGGGVWCAGTNGLVANCLIATNAAYNWGAGVFQANLNNCLVLSNSAFLGGGLYRASANNSLLAGNVATYSQGGGGGSYQSTLLSCTVVSNSNYGICQGACTNCIIMFNAPANFSGGVFAYCCLNPPTSGSGDIYADPQLLPDGYHLASTSPCRGAGIYGAVTGLDIDGKAWTNPPSMGCSEWHPEPLIIRQPTVQLTTTPLGLSFASAAAGDTNQVWYWSKDGVLIENGGRYSSAHAAGLTISGLSLTDAGSYQTLVSNAFGMATSAVVQVVLHCVDAAGLASAPPYLSWETAATNIQDAIDAAAPGEFVLVTNGLYATGGKAMTGGLTNRVTLDKPVAVTSVNGYAATIIQGASMFPTNGPSAIRCAWLANGALLNGFTLRGGATRSSGSDLTILQGGGVWCAGTNGLLANCLLATNSAAAQGGGAFQVILNNCIVVSNSSSQGGGVAQVRANNSLFVGNNALSGGGAYLSTLLNCTLVSNFNYGAYLGSCTNCILYFNGSGNYSGGTLSYCCSTPVQSGPGNISTDPQIPDGLHLANTSPCRGAGTSSVVTGTDLVGFPWANPPSMGCSEWQPAPLTPVAPDVQFTGAPVGLSLGVQVRGQGPFTCWWTRNGLPIENDAIFSGAHTTNLMVGAILDGTYQVVVSNAFGITTSPVRQVVFHYVDVAGRAPSPPYLSWATAATNIQDAIGAVSAGEIVMVTNGLYATGGKVIAGDLLNRVALDKPILLTSVNGYKATIIQGAGLLPTNGTSAVRCAWLTNGAVLNGFTLRGGATRTSGDSLTLECGGGAWCGGLNGVLANCMLAANAATSYGGGAYQAILNNCVVVSNSASLFGGGVCQARLRNCLVMANGGSGAICSGSTLVNCTVVGNYNSGVSGSACTNCILYFNMGGNYQTGPLVRCCTQPFAGPGNISDDPQFLADGFHLSATSPCRGAGATNVAAGLDIDGQSWSEPPSIGCDDWQPIPVFATPMAARVTTIPPGLSFGALVAGDTNCVWYWTRNGIPLEDGGRVTLAHSGNLTLSGLTPADAGKYQAVVSNAFGMATGAVTVVIHCVDEAGRAPSPPYLDWPAAATNIQDAIDAASAGDFVLVTNGLYRYGGKLTGGTENNRVVADKPLSITSLNGPAVTVIQGAAPLPTNGPSAVRCVWLTSGAVLNGFTLRGGATSSSGSRSGGGVWCASSDALVINCVLAANTAADYGGGAYQGTLNNCLILSNWASLYGGGALGSTLNNCQVRVNSSLRGGGLYLGAANNSLFTGNTAGYAGGAAFQSALVNCTVLSNSTYGVSATPCTNCIFRFNSPSDFNGGPLAFCCAQSLISGPGNFNADPQFLADGFHLSASSPCRGAGTNSVLTGSDIDGQRWSNPPSMGCDEWQPAPLFATSLAARTTTLSPGLSLTALVAGDTNWVWCWSKDGVPLEDGGRYRSAPAGSLAIDGLSLADAGTYQAIVSNAFGMATSAVTVAIHCVDAAGQAPAPPYLGWATAATNIQDAIDAASANDVVLVTNGLYRYGGKLTGGIDNNRVVVDKPLSVASVNGPAVTVIQAMGPAGTNGPSAVRGAWLTSGAVLNGFTLRGGATSSSGARSGGGVWCASTDALLVNCTLANNAAMDYGAGAYQGTLNNCLILSNSAGSFGGGAYGSTLKNCRVVANVGWDGAGAYGSRLTGCLVTRNAIGVPFWGNGGGATASVLLNCTVTSNANYGTFNCTGTNSIVMNAAPTGTYSYCCTPGMYFGPLNLTSDPQLLPDGIHLSITSPCRGAGASNVVAGVDIDGQPWGTPPSIGCDDWQPAPFFAANPSAQLTTSPFGFSFSSLVVGATNNVWQWSKDGVALEDGGRFSSTHTASPSIRGLTLSDAGSYQAVVSNGFGIVTSTVAFSIHCVDAAGAAPASPYLSWSTAATNIQDAVDAAAPYDFVLVTNGVYASGGRLTVPGQLNRLTLDKPLGVTSINGSALTVIQGTNASPAARCASLTDGAVLNGFTLCGGTAAVFSGAESAAGGGVWSPLTGGVVANSLIAGNTAFGVGGGASGVVLKNCIVVSNAAWRGGGGLFAGRSLNCLFAWNNSPEGAASDSILVNSTVVRNSAPYAFYECQVTNCIFSFNQSDEGWYFGNYYSTVYSCWRAWPPYGEGNIGADPMLVDPMHLAVNSPCRGMGYSPVVTGTDLDGNAWSNPPSMGCCEVVESALTGPLTVSIQASNTLVRLGATLPLTGVIVGRASRIEWSFGDGPAATNLSFFTRHAWTNAGEYTITFTAYNLDNPGGVSTNFDIYVMPQPVADPQLLTTMMGTPVPVTLTGSDADPVPLTFSIKTPPANGLLTGSPPAVAYAPNPGYFGADPFTFQVDDGRGCVASAQVCIVVVKTNSPGIPQVAITSPLGGLPQLALQGEPYEHYGIEASQDLVHWTTLTNILCTNSVFGFIDPDGWQYPQRFYRAALLLTLPTLTSSGLTADNQFGFSYAGDIGRTYQVLASTNLVDWDMLTNVVATASPMPFQDLDAAHYPARFYRIRLAP